MSDPISAPGGATGNPWDRRGETGAVSALLETVRLFVTAPAEGYRRTLERGDYAGPLIFAVVVGFVGAVANQVWGLLFSASMFSYLPSDLQDQLGLFAMTGMSTLIGLLLAPLFIAIGVFIWSAILHLCVMIVGGLSESSSGFEGTFRVICFASVAQLANVVPFFGGLIGLVWSLILLIIGLAILHRTSHGRAFFAILIPILVCCVCGIFLAISFGAGIAAMMEGVQP